VNKKTDKETDIQRELASFKAHCVECRPHILTMCTDEEQRSIEIKQAELEDKLVSLIEEFHSFDQNLTALVLVGILGLIHNRETRILRSIALTVEIASSGFLDLLTKPAQVTTH